MEEVSYRMKPSISRKVAFLSMRDLSGFFAYDHLCFPAMAERGWEGSEVAWDLPDIDWSSFAAVVIRSTWDYQRRYDEFRVVLESIERSGTLLLNSPAIVRWNIDKRYLQELEQRGVRIVPTEWLPRFIARSEISRLFDRFQTSELVVKPTVGANADDTFRLRFDSQANWAEAEAIFESKPLMVQPFLESIVTEGEYSLFYFDGVFSHAVLKRPAQGDFRVQEEHGGEITAYDPGEDLLKAGQVAMSALPEPVLYGRVDLVRLADGDWGVIEIELIEPSLYFPYDPKSIERFAAALDRRLRQQ
jgi:glutathione synthase/RimK-type ligase-like ATP-grasp enzyme